MTKIKLLGYLLALSIAFVSCSGEDREPGPQGATGATGETGETGDQGPAGEGFEKVGYFQGTVSGNRTDGTAFTETFKYEYGSPILSFEDNYINLVRTNTPYFTEGYFSGNDLQLLGNTDSYFQINNLELSDNTLVVVPNFTSVLFKFSKELNQTDLFLVAARPYFYDIEGLVREISANQNETYKFITAMDGTIAFGGEHLDYSGPDVYVVGAYINNVPYDFYYRKVDGTLLKIYSNYDGIISHITSGILFDLYDQLLLKYNADVDKPSFFNKNTGASLHTEIPDVPADQFTVTNYVHDASTGVVSFDFVLKISKYRPRTGYIDGFNSSGNDLTITGSFSSGKKVYSNVVSRTASGG